MQDDDDDENDDYFTVSMDLIYCKALMAYCLFNLLLLILPN